MLVIHLQPVLESRGITKPYTFLRSLGITHGTAHRLMTKSAVMHLDHMERLCRHLNCTPNELMEFTPSEEAPLPEGHALNRLRGRGRGNIAQQLRNLPPEAVEQVWDLIDGLKKGSGG